MNRIEKEVYDRILDKQLLGKERLDEIVRESLVSKTPLLKEILVKNLLDESDLLAILSAVFNIRYVDMNDIVVEKAAVDKVHVRVAWHYEFMPVSFSGKTLTIAVNLPLSIRAEDEIRLSLGCEVNMLLARKDQILDSLKKYYGLAADTVDRMMGYGRADFGDQGLSFSGIEDIEKKAEEASVARLVNQIILEAYKKRATDIHIEPYRGKVSLRYRIDGKLHDQPVSDDFMRFLPPILSRVKIIANLNIVERRVPQDGKAIVKITDQVLDLRVSFMPTPHGESVVIRILPAKVRWDLANLGLLKDDVAKFDALLKNTSGILLVTGPTGSGKTTTLYSCIDKINTKDRKILSIEDPIEYEITGITQIQVNPEVGLTFARGLRSMLRQDPDVMMVGEIRDKETAEIAIRVALTGHLVLSTLHTNDAASGVTRLMDIGIPPYLLESTVKAFIAQRLVRVICDGCSEEDRGVQQSVKERIVRSMGSGSVHALKVYKGRGCEKCSFTGFHGRTAIFEILELTDEIRKMITLGSMASEINKVAVEKNGMRTLLQDGWIKVARGITTPDEILNVCQ